jgi:hypothetical protein
MRHVAHQTVELLAPEPFRASVVTSSRLYIL